MSIAEALLEYELLDSAEIDVVIRGEDLHAFREKRAAEAQQRDKTRAPKSGFTTTLPQDTDDTDDKRVLEPAAASS